MVIIKRSFLKVIVMLQAVVFTAESKIAKEISTMLGTFRLMSLFITYNYLRRYIIITSTRSAWQLELLLEHLLSKTPHPNQSYSMVLRSYTKIVKIKNLIYSTSPAIPILSIWNCHLICLRTMPREYSFFIFK